MTKWQRKLAAGAILLLFLGPLFGLLQPVFTNTIVSAPLAQGSIHSNFVTIDTAVELSALSNTVVSDDVNVDPSENITGVTVSKFTLSGGYGFNVQNISNHALQFSIEDSIFNTNIDDGFNMQGSPIISGHNISISGPLQSNNYPDAQIGSPILTFNNVNASQIHFRVRSGTFIWNHSKTSSVVLNGFTNAILDSDNITTGLWVEGPGIVYIANSQINGTIHESVKPTISCPLSYNVPFSYVFQPQVQVTIDLGGSDNIRGPAYGLNYTVNIYKNGALQETVNVLTNSYSLTVDTAASYELRFTCKDKQGNVSTEATITVVPQADLLWFILMIVFIAAGAVAAIAIFYLWKQRQWQKTALVEIPA